MRENGEEKFLGEFATRARGRSPCDALGTAKNAFKEF